MHLLGIIVAAAAVATRFVERRDEKYKRSRSTVTILLPLLMHSTPLSSLLLLLL